MIARKPHFFHILGGPLALSVLVASCFGLPLNSWPAFLCLSFVAVAALIGGIRASRRRWVAAVAVAVVCVIARIALPTHYLEEGHSVFSSAGRGPLAAALPADVFAAMRQLQAALPQNYDQKPPRRAWAFSADGIWDSSTLSRARKGIDFADRWSLRVAAVNEVAYNDRRKGLYLPLVFRFDLPETARGGRLCWTGTVYWPRDLTAYEEITAAAPACREIPADGAWRDREGRRSFTIYAADFDRNRPLAMRLDGTGPRDYTPQVATIVGLAGALVILGLLVRMRLSAIAGWALAILSIAAYIARRTSGGEPPAFSGLAFMGRGNDGLIYFGGGREVLSRLVDGDWIAALRGGADVFYFAPGMRYAWAAFTGLFGDTFFGYFLVVTIIPFLVLHLVRTYAGQKSAILLFWCFLLVPVFEALGFLHWYYVKLAVRGFGGALGWVALYAGVLLLVRRFEWPDMRRSGLFAAGLCFTLAIACRPNLTVGIVVLVAGTAALLLWDSRIAMPSRLWDAAMLGLGASIVLAIPFHNWYFGAAFVPLTRAWNVEANLQFGASNYVETAAAVLLGAPSWPAKVGRILRHIGIWMGYYEFWLIIPYVTLWVALLRRDMTPFVRVLAASLLADHAVFLFYPGFPRYLYGIWLLTFLVFIVVLRRVYWPAAKRRWPRLAAAGEPAWLRFAAYLDPMPDNMRRKPAGVTTGPIGAAG